MASLQYCLCFALLWEKGRGPKVGEVMTEKWIVGRWYQTRISSSLLGRGFFYKHTKWTVTGLEKRVSWYPITYQLFWYIFSDSHNNCSQNKLHWPRECHLLKCIMNNSDWTPFPRELLMVPATLCYEYIHVRVCGGEQVGKALLCPCSNLLDLNQWQLGGETVPYFRQVTPWVPLCGQHSACSLCHFILAFRVDSGKVREVSMQGFAHGGQKI